MLAEVLAGCRRAVSSAPGCMLTAAGCYAGVPLLVAWTGGAANPLLFSGLWRLGALAGYGGFLMAFHRPLILLTAASGADYALFAWSAELTGAGITVALFDA